MPLRNNGMISEQDYKGLPFVEAKDFAERGGFTVRIVEEDGVHKMLDMSARGDRINFRVRDGIVTSVFTG